MASKGPQGKVNEARIKTFIADVLANRPDEIRNSKGGISGTKIAKLYKKEMGENVTRQTVSKYIADRDLINYKNINIPETNERMKEIDRRIAIAKNISNDESQKANDRLKALNSYNSLIKTKIDYEERLMARKLRQAEIKRPTHLIKFGHIENVKKTCPKCKHQFYDLPVSKEVNDNEKETK